MADLPSTPPQQFAASQGSESQTPAREASTSPVVVKKYANRRLYNTETSSYITLENLAEMIRAGRDFVVYDAKSGDDITRGVLTQIIVEEESKGSAMLPTTFLRQLIGFYGGNLEGVVPRYLEYSMSTFSRQQQQFRSAVERTFSPFLPSGVEEMNRQNMALFERAMSMWNPFARPADPHDAANSSAPESFSAEASSADRSFPDPAFPDPSLPAGMAEPAAPSPTASAEPSQNPELAWLRSEVESLRRQLAAAHASAVLPNLAGGSPVIPDNLRREPMPGRRPGRKAGDPVI